ncbi:MAG: hypothetical protein AAF639_36705 [Chloroflexota bacterium]
MTALEAIQTVQYMTVKQKRFAILEAESWEKLLSWLESLEDSRIVKQAYQELDAANGDREKADWRQWDELKTELESTMMTPKLPLDEAAKLLLDDYENDEELTAFTALDGDDIHETW